MVADKGYLIDPPQAASIIENNMYVHDILCGGTPKQVQRFVGKKIGDSTHIMVPSVKYLVLETSKSKPLEYLVN